MCVFAIGFHSIHFLFGKVHAAIVVYVAKKTIPLKLDKLNLQELCGLAGVVYGDNVN